MNDIDKNIEEFKSYLQGKGKSEYTVNHYGLTARRLLFNSNKTPETLTWDDVTKFVTTISELSISGKSSIYSAIKKYLRYLKFKHKNNILDDYEREKEEADEDLFLITAKNRQKKKDILTIDEIQQLLQASKNSKRDYAIIMLFFHSWQRVGSIVALNVSEIDFKGVRNPKDNRMYHKIHINRAKSDQSYDIWVEQEVIHAIDEYLKVREKPISKDGSKSHSGRIIRGYRIGNYRQKLYHEDAVFLSGTGRRLTEKAINDMMKRYAIQCNIKKRMHSHIWRRSGISIADSANVPMSQIMGRSGHSNLQSVKPYLNPHDDDTNSNISNALKPSPKPEPQTKPELEPQPVRPMNQQLIQTNKSVIQRLTQQFSEGKISEEVYLTALENLQKNDEDISGYQ